MSLKTPKNRMIYRELEQKGIKPMYFGEARSWDGAFESQVFVSVKAFDTVCDMVLEEREKRKKWWRFGR